MNAISAWGRMTLSFWPRESSTGITFASSTLERVTRVQLSPWIALANNIQTDTDSRNLGWQARMRWILNPGNDLDLVYSHNWLSDPVGGFSTVDRQMASKLVYTHRF